MIFTNLSFLKQSDLDKSIFFKGTVSVILSDPPCKNDYTRYTTVPLKALSELHEGIEFCHTHKFSNP